MERSHLATTFGPTGCFDTVTRIGTLSRLRDRNRYQVLGVHWGRKPGFHRTGTKTRLDLETRFSMGTGPVFFQDRKQLFTRTGTRFSLGREPWFSWDRNQVLTGTETRFYQDRNPVFRDAFQTLSSGWNPQETADLSPHRWASAASISC